MLHVKVSQDARRAWAHLFEKLVAIPPAGMISSCENKVCISSLVASAASVSGPGAELTASLDVNFPLP